MRFDERKKTGRGTFSVENDASVNASTRENVLERNSRPAVMKASNFEERKQEWRT